MAENPLPALPAELAKLRVLAYNLRWSWHPATRELFHRIAASSGDAARLGSVPVRPTGVIDDDAAMAPFRPAFDPVRLLAEVPRERFDELARDQAFCNDVAAAVADLKVYLRGRETWFRQTHGDAADMRVAYFSAEFGVADCLPIFAGGLGVLAGDHLKSASDLGVPLVGVGLLYREGFFRQRVDPDGSQHEAYTAADPTSLPLTLERAADGAELVVAFPFCDRELHVRVWRADVGRVPLYLLDTDLEANAPDDRRITDRLYGGDLEHRLRQEIVLGLGGMRALAALGIRPTVIHLNEGHAAFAALERVAEIGAGRGDALAAAAARLGSIVFTTHTPVPAGHDTFPPALLEHYLGAYVSRMAEPWDALVALGRSDPTDRREPFCMTTLALRLAQQRNGVSRLHGAVSRRMWQSLWPDRVEGDVPIGHVTNGVHLPSWVSPVMSRLYESHIGRASGAEVHDPVSDQATGSGWQRVSRIPLDDLWATRRAQRAALVARVRSALARQAERSGEGTDWVHRVLDPDALTIVFARRFATYKRATLILSDLDRLIALLTAPRPVQFIFAGKAHPKDEPGQAFLREIVAFARRPEARHRFVFLEDYDLELARDLVQGADVWLNVPRRPHEASGTSGMKAAANGALNLSIRDGWWAEAWQEHNALAAPIGWLIEPTGTQQRDGSDPAGSPGEVTAAGAAQPASRQTAGPPPGEMVADPELQDRADAESLFSLLESEVVPLFYERDENDLPVRWLQRVQASIRQLVPFFNTDRMVREYVENAYLPAQRHAADAGARKSAAHRTRLR